VEHDGLFNDEGFDELVFERHLAGDAQATKWGQTATDGARIQNRFSRAANNCLLSGTFCITRCATNKFYVQKHPNSAHASTTDFFGKRSASRAPPHLHRCGGRVLRLEPVWRPAGPSDFAFCSASHSRRAVLAASSASITTDCNLSSETHLPYPVASIALRAAFMAASSSRCNILSSLYDGM
jgi:hypothetical protein